MFPHEIYVEIFKFLEYAYQGPIRCSCKRLSTIPLTFEQACSEPTIPEIVRFLYKELDLIKRKPLNILESDRHQYFNYLFSSIDDVYNDIHQVCFTNGAQSACIALNMKLDKFTVEHYNEKYPFPSNTVDFKTSKELIQLLTSYKLDFTHINSETSRFFRLLCRQRPFNTYETDTFCVKSCITKFRSTMYEDRCRKQHEFLEIVGLFDYGTADKIEQMGSDLYGEDEYYLTFDSDYGPGPRFDEITKFVLDIFSHFGSEEYDWLSLR